MATSPPPLPAGTFRALRHRNYRLYFFGQLVSLLGSWMQITAMTWLAYHLTDQSFWAALTGAAQAFPTVVLGAWGGSLGDRRSRRDLIFVSQALLLVLALVLAALVFFGRIQPWQLVLVALGNGLVNAIDLPCRLAFVMDLVGREDLLNAVALNSLLFNGARAVGPALGALVLRWLGPGLCFLCNAVSYLAVLAALLAMRLPPGVGGPASRAGPSLREGFRFLGTQPTLRLLFVLVGSMSLFGWPVLSLLPALGDSIHKSDGSVYGVLLSAIGTGALLAALGLARFGSLERRYWLLGGGVTAAGLGQVGLSVARTLPPALVCCLLLGFGLVLVFSTAQAVTQLTAGDHNRGVVMGIWSMVIIGPQPLGALLAGTSADRWGLTGVFLVQGWCTLAVGACLLPLLLACRSTQPPLQSRNEDRYQ